MVPISALIIRPNLIACKKEIPAFLIWGNKQQSNNALKDSLTVPNNISFTEYKFERDDVLKTKCLIVRTIKSVKITGNNSRKDIKAQPKTNFPIFISYDDLLLGYPIR